MKNIIKTILWSIRHPRFAACWFRHGKPYSSVYVAVVLAILTLALSARAQLSTNTPATPTSQASFFNQAFNWFTSANPANDGVFTNGSALLWAGVDSIQGGNATLVNEIGLSYGLGTSKRLSLEAVERNGGVSGTAISQQVGLGLNFNMRDMRVTGYASGGYLLSDSEITLSPGQVIKTKDRLFGEIGIRAYKALGLNTYAYVSLGAQFPTSRQVYGAGIGIKF